MSFKLDFFFMVPSIVVLGTRIQNIEMRSSKNIIKNIDQKVMTKFGFECKFHDLEYFEVGFKKKFLDFIIKLRETFKNLQ